MVGSSRCWKGRVRGGYHAEGAEGEMVSSPDNHSKGRGGEGKHRTKNRNKSTSYLIAVSSVISKKSSARRLRKAHQSKKERGIGRTGYAPGVFEVTILGSRLFRSKGSPNLAKLCFFSIEVSTFESPFDQKIGI